MANARTAITTLFIVSTLFGRYYVGADESCTFVNESPLFVFPPSGYVFDEVGLGRQVNFTWTFTSWAKGENCTCHHFVLYLAGADSYKSDFIDCAFNFTSVTPFYDTVTLTEAGDYTWKIESCNWELYNNEVQICTVLPFSGVPFCVRAGPQTKPTLDSPKGGAPQSRTPTFTWETISDWGRSCTTDDVNTITILLKNETTDFQVWHVLDGSETSFDTPVFESFENGLYTWKLSISNGYSSALNSSEAQFTICDNGTSPVAPVLTIPGAEYLPRLPSFTWTLTDWGYDCGNSAARKFVIYIDTSLSPTTLVGETASSVYSWSATEKLNNGQTYRIRVSAVNGMELETSSAVYTFVVCEDTAPSVLLSVSPPSSVVGDIDSPITFSWASPSSWGFVCGSNASLSYEFSYAGDTFTTYENTYESTIADLSGLHSWSVTAVNNALSKRSDFSFSLCSPTGTGVPSNLAVEDKLSTPKLVWECYTGDSCSLGTPSFLLHLYNSGRNLSVSVETTSKADGGEYTPSPPLSSGVWTWIVFANNGYDANWNNAASQFCITSVDKPTLISPADGNHTNSLVTFEWIINHSYLCPEDDSSLNCTLVLGTSTNVTRISIGSATTGAMSYSIDLPISGEVWWNVEVIGATTGSLFARSDTHWFDFFYCFGQSASTATEIFPFDATLGDGSTLTWEDKGLGTNCGSSTSIRGYTVSVMDKSSFLRTITSTTTAVNVSGLAAGVTYQWTIAASNGLTTVSSGPFSFIHCLTGATVPAVTGASPSNQNVPLPVKLQWDAINFKGCGPRSIEILLNGELIDTVAEDKTEYTIRTTILNSEGSYNWTLIAYDGDKSTKNGVYSFSVCISVPPSAPGLDSLLPVDGSHLSLDDAVLSWHDASMDWGSSSCGVLEKKYYLYLGTSPSNLTLLAVLADTTTSYSLKSNRTFIETSSSFLWFWNVIPSNSPSILSTASSTQSLWLCTSINPSIPRLVSPVPASSIGLPALLEWDEISFGEDCIGQEVYYLLFIGPSTADLQSVAELPAYATSYLLENYTTGQTYWKISKISPLAIVPSAVEYFYVCTPGIPDAPVPTPSLTAGVLVAPVTLSWSRPNMGSCSGEESYNVFITKGSVPQYRATTTNLSFTFSFDSVDITLTSGTYYWSVQANNGYFTSALSKKQQIEICVPSPPPKPVLISPPDGAEDEPQNITFHVAPTISWGESCGVNPGAAEYRLLTGLETLDTDSPVSVAGTTAPNSETGTITFAVTLQMATWVWSVDYANDYGLTNRAAQRYVDVCQEYLPTAPTPLTPESGDKNITTFEPVLTWLELKSTDFGKVCSSVQSVAQIELYFGVGGSWVTGNESSLPHVWSGVPSATSYKFDALNVSTVYTWQLAAYNGYHRTMSPIFNFTTRTTDCSLVNCTFGKGLCDKATAICVCLPGWHGPSCDIEDSTSTEAEGLPKWVIAIIAVGSVLVALVGAAVIAIILVRKVRARQRYTIKPPDFDEIKFSPVKEPMFFIPEQENFPVALMEQFLFGSDNMKPIWDLCKLTAVTEADTVAKALVYASERRKQGLPLLTMLISNEVDEANSPEALFRANSFATKAFKYYSKMIGLPYVFKTLAVLLQGLIRDLEDTEEEQKRKDEEAGSGEVSSVKLFNAQYELDPDKIGDIEDASINVLTLEFSCQKFIVQITRSAPNCPGEFKRLCAHIREIVEAKFPPYVYKAIGAFIFLRFYNTAITVPENYGLMTEPPGPVARRQLIMLSKVLQNLSNGVKFGDKEEFMKKLNRFIDTNAQPLLKFFDRLCDKDAPLAGDVVITDEMYHACIATLFNQLCVINQDSTAKLDSLNLPPEIVACVRAGGQKKKKHRHHHNEEQPLITSATSTQPTDG
ncbi:GTPase-activator protein for Ras family GTPase [Pelomyxa schiedti]|nr:GTPase-activator protein for Ras family GTPase [Pelomyxa schiedti]